MEYTWDILKNQCKNDPFQVPFWLEVGSVEGLDSKIETFRHSVARSGRSISPRGAAGATARRSPRSRFRQTARLARGTVRHRSPFISMDDVFLQGGRSNYGFLTCSRYINTYFMSWLIGGAQTMLRVTIHFGDPPPHPHPHTT